MSEHLLTSVVTVIMAIVGVALIAILVSRNAQTGNVLTSGAGALSTLLGTAESPVTGSGLGFMAPSFSFNG